MPDYLAPGVFVEETSFRTKTIVGADLGGTAFIGPTRTGPVLDPEAGERPELLTSVLDFERLFGSADDLQLGGMAPVPNVLAHAVRAFFDNGGTRLYVVRIFSGDSAALNDGSGGAPPRATDCDRALKVVAALEDVSTVAAPGNWMWAADATEARLIAQALVSHTELSGRYRFAVLDAPPGQTPAQVRDLRATVDSRNAALYYPGVVIANPLARPGSPAPRELTLPPSGFVCGIYARVDRERGVFKAPANEIVRGALRFERDVKATEQDTLNPLGINCLRFFPARGYRVWGARTLSSDPEWKYVNVRRYFHYLAASIDRGTQWAVFEPNAEPLWAHIRTAVADFLFNEWKVGALLGSKPDEAFFVRCDRTTMTQDDLDHGRLVCLVGIAAVKPAEFIVFRIGQKTADAAG